MLTTLRAVALGAALVAVIAPAGAQTPAPNPPAQTPPTYVFDVAPQSLSSAVLVFARQAKVQVVFGAPIAAGLKSASLSGRYSLQDAMSRLLAGTGLDWRMAGGTITIAPAPAGTLTFNTVTVEGTQRAFPDPNGFGAGSGANGGSDPTATEGTGSFTTNGTALVGIPLSLLHSTQTVGVITNAQIQQQNLTDVSAALNYMPGITLTDVTANGALYLSRGFGLKHYRLDGGASLDLDNSVVLGSDTDLSEFDSVQVLRGSDGLVGGDAPPSGVLDLQRKRPLDHAQFVLSAAVGSWNELQGVLDATGPLGFDGHLRGRAVLSVTDQDEFYNVAHQTRWHVYGVAEGDLDADTILRAGASYDADRQPGFNELGLPRGGGKEDLNLPRSTCICATWNRLDRRETEMFATLEHRFDDDWTFRTDATILAQTGDSNAAAWIGRVPALFYDGSDSSVYSQHKYALSATLNGTFRFNDLDQQVVVGVQYTRSTFGLTQNNLFDLAVPLDPLHFNAALFDPEPKTGTLSTVMGHGMMEDEGAFAGLRLTPIERFHLSLGVRVSFDYLDQVNNFDGLIVPAKRRDGAIPTPSAALSYDVTPDVAAYASYAEIYAAQSEYVTVKLVPLPPLAGHTYEVGVRAAPWGGALNASLAFYYAEQTNQPVSVTSDDPALRGNFACCFIAVGKVKSTGLDLEVSGELLPGWQIRGGYTYNDNGYDTAVKALILDQGSAGIFAPLQPKNQLKVWTSYDVDAQWTFGGGVRFESVRSSVGSVCSVPNDPGCSTGEIMQVEFSQAAHAVLDLRAAYRFDERWEAALNVTNVTDTRYFSTLESSTTGNFYGQPRAFLVSLRAVY